MILIKIILKIHDNIGVSENSNCEALRTNLFQSSSFSKFYDQSFLGFRNKPSHRAPELLESGQIQIFSSQSLFFSKRINPNKEFLKKTFR